MAVLGCEGFDYLTSTSPHADIALRTMQPSGGVWSSGLGNSTKLAGTLGGSTLAASSTTGNTQVMFPSTYLTLISGIRYKLPSSQASAQYICFFMDTSSLVQCGIGISTAGKIIMFRSTVATVLATGSTVYSVSTEHYFEVKATIAGGTSGFIECRVDGGAEVITASGTNTQATSNAYTNGFGFQFVANLSSTADDVYIADTTGSAPTNDYLGPQHVETLFPTTATSVGWTPNASTNVSQIQEVNSDNDTTFNYATAAKTDMFNHTSLSINPSDIYLAEVVSKMKKSDVSQSTIRTKLTSGASTSNGASNTRLAVANYNYYADAYATDPANGSWLKAAIDSTLIGYERV